jgi:hypothetical protein
LTKDKEPALPPISIFEADWRAHRSVSNDDGNRTGIDEISLIQEHRSRGQGQETEDTTKR